jgi:hypothetical protein
MISGKCVTRTLIAAALLCLWGGQATATPIILPVNPTATYLRVSDLDNTDGPVFDTVPYSLVALGIHPGDLLHFDVIGDFSSDMQKPDTGRDMIAVFSTSAILLDRHLLSRVPGAISAGPTFVTQNTLWDNLLTDIPEDFNFGNRAPGGITVRVPTGALYLFLSVPSSAYSDNRDPDGDYAASLTAVPEPGSSLLLFGLGLVGLRAWRKRLG